MPDNPGVDRLIFCRDCKSFSFLSLLRRADFRTDFCDLIVSMEQTQVGTRPVVGGIVVVSGLAVSFLLWLVYEHLPRLISPGAGCFCRPSTHF